MPIKELRIGNASRAHKVQQIIFWFSIFYSCLAINFMCDRMSLRWVLEHQFTFLKALLFVMMDLTGEVSSGAVDRAKSNLENMLTMCAKPLEADQEEMKAIQKKSFHDVTHELVKRVTSPNTTVREQVLLIAFVASALAGRYTVKLLKFGTPQTIAIIVLKIEKFDVTLH